MQSTVKGLIKKVTLELVYDVVEERTAELKQGIEKMRTEHHDAFESLRAEHHDDFKSMNARIDQIHMRLDQMMHMLADLKK